MLRIDLFPLFVLISLYNVCGPGLQSSTMVWTKQELLRMFNSSKDELINGESGSFTLETTVGIKKSPHQRLN